MPNGKKKEERRGTPVPAAVGEEGGEKGKKSSLSLVRKVGEKALKGKKEKKIALTIKRG